MKTISSNEIESVASSRSVFDRGYSLFSSDGVLRIELEREKNGSHTIYAMVEGSMGAHYNTRASIVLHKNTMRVSGFSCNCKAAETYAGACKHVVATLFEYNYQYEEESDEAGADYVQSSDEELKSLVDYYVMQDRNQFCQEYGNGDVRLIPILHLEADRESMELKIGTTQMYVVKDIGELVDNIKQMRHVSYGKKLAFTHSQSAFTRESTSIVNLLLELDSENEFSYRYHGWGYSNQQMRRSCTLSPAMLDRLMELYEGRTLQVDDQLLDQKDEIPIVRKNPRLPLNITGLHEQGAQVQMEPVFLTEGSKQWYILWNHCFYICTREYYEQVKGFLRLMTQERNQMKKYAGYYGRYGYYQEQLKMPTFYLSVQDYGAFAKNVLPMVQDVLDVQVKKIDFESYEPLEAVFHSYLDKVGSHIECRAKVLYGTQEYDVAEIPTKEQASRDIRREFQVRTILEGYFELAKDQKTYVSKEEDAMLEFLETGFQQLESVSEIFATDRFKNMRVIPMPKITAGISVKGNLLDVSWDVEGMSAQEVMDILADYKNKKKYHKLKSGDFLRMDENSLAVLVELNEGLHLTKEQLKERKAEVPLYRSLYLDSLMKDNADHIRLERDKEFRTVIREMRSMEDGENEIPQQIQAVLRPYQEIGFQWLCALAKFGFGGILADDMGLGKTLQVLAFLAAQPGTHALVVCPASLVFNWEAECQRFYPSAKIAAVAGAAAARQMQI